MKINNNNHNNIYKKAPGISTPLYTKQING